MVSELRSGESAGPPGPLFRDVVWAITLIAPAGGLFLGLAQGFCELFSSLR